MPNQRFIMFGIISIVAKEVNDTKMRYVVLFTSILYRKLYCMIFCSMQHSSMSYILWRCGLTAIEEMA